MNTGNKYFWLGLDIGSVSLKCIIIDSAYQVIFSRYERTAGQPARKTLELFSSIKASLGNVAFSGAVATGSGKELIAEPTGITTVNEIVAHATAAWKSYPDITSIFEIGGQDSKYITIGRDNSGRHYLKDHAFNQLCAAGTGAFLDQQAERIGLSIEQLGRMATAAGKPANVAGRCSVFAKSDMIHLQQKAVPVEEIASGLCFALARNFLSTLCKGKIPDPPILFQGGVAANEGVVKAFREILHLNNNDLLVPENFDVMGAMGSALMARENHQTEPVTIAQLLHRLSETGDRTPVTSHLRPIQRTHQMPTTKRSIKPVGVFSEPFFLGIDIGSVSTKGVIIDSCNSIIASSYGPTASRPIHSLQTCITALENQSSGKNITHVVSTGSGRHIAKALLGGGSVIDEISAQSVSCGHFFPDADTIIEIGGQDSKFIRMQNGKIQSFKMNKACAAGTGAFLEEQAGRLNVHIEEQFSEYAFRSSTPAELGSKCTVFMDSDLVHHLQRGTCTEDLCAGLAYSIAENYLEKVVGSTPIGDAVIFQGGVARNEAVSAVFQQLTGTSVQTHPHPEISGAFGAALTAKQEYEQAAAPFPLSLAHLKFEANIETFDCQSCENLCEIRKISVAKSPTTFFGSVCGRFEKSQSQAIPASDPFALREQLLHDCVQQFETEPYRGVIGIPLALSLHDHLPFWGTLFNALGFSTVFSQNTRRSIVELGIMHSPGEFCYPMKVLFGHVHSLIKKEVERIFIPHLRMFTPPQEKTPRYACPYTQAAPYIVRENVSSGRDILSLDFPMDSETKYWVAEATQKLGIDPTEIEKALDIALAAQQKFSHGCQEAGKKILIELNNQNRRGAVLIGRPYNTSDRYVNLNLARKLHELDIEPLPYDFIPHLTKPLPQLWSRIRWGYGRRLVQSARALKEYPVLGAVIVTNFGCGPDAFIDQYIEHELQDTPHIVLEFDDHQAEAGLVTRLEAFSRNFSITRKKRISIEGRDPGKPRIPLREYTYYVPSFMDHAYALTGALKASGCKTVLLPPTDDESWNLGLRHSYGKECHPFISFTGDILKAATRPDFIPEKACYYGPSYFGPCLLPQYCLALHLILERVGLGEITVMNIADPTNMKELGTPYMMRLALGIYTIDRFFKWKTEIEPYQQNPGEVTSVYQQILVDLENGLASGTFIQTLKRSIQALAKVQLTARNGSRPKIGIIGDIYTRINTHSNNNLYQKLQDDGLEVWPSSSLIDVSFLGMEQLHAEHLRKGKVLSGSAAKLLIPGIKLARWLVDRYFPRDIRTPQERDYHAISNISGKYADSLIDKALSLNINRIEELHLAGADGVIHVMCHNCMLGNVTASLTPSMQRDMGDIPIANLVYEGLKSTHNTNRIEAFIHQVKSYRRNHSS